MDPITVTTKGVDAAALVASIREAVEKKAAAGVYDDARIARAERTNLLALQGDEEFTEFFVHSLRQSVFVDIGDMEIHEKRRFCSGFFVKLKQTIWALLRFYTYRLWSQQNQTNGMLVTALEGLLERSKAREAELAKRIDELERRLDGKA